MGEEVERVTPAVWLGREKKPLDRAGLTYDGVVELIGLQLNIKKMPELYALAEQLVELSVIDQASLLEGVRPGEKRRKAREIATAIKDQALQAIAAIEAITALSRLFTDDIGLSPPIFRQVFSSETAEFDIAKYYDGKWERSIRKSLGPLAALAIQPSAKARVPNLPLRNAELLCKEFWTRDENRDWKVFKLKDAAVRKANCIGDLKTLVSSLWQTCCRRVG